MNKDVRIDYGNGMFYEEVYYNDIDQLSWQGVTVNDRAYGYHVDYWKDGSADEDWTGYFFKNELVSADNAEGYCYIWHKEAI